MWPSPNAAARRRSCERVAECMLLFGKYIRLWPSNEQKRKRDCEWTAVLNCQFISELLHSEIKTNNQSLSNRFNRLRFIIKSCLWRDWTVKLTCVFESGRAQLRTPERRSSAIFWFKRWAKTTVSGMHSSVSSVAYPNINPCKKRVRI